MSEEKKAKIAFVGCGPMSTGALYPAFRLITEAGSFISAQGKM